MSATELQMEVWEIPDNIVKAYEQKVIEKKDLAPNIAAHMVAGLGSEDLTVYEIAERWKNAYQLATICVQEFTNLQGETL